MTRSTIRHLALPLASCLAAIVAVGCSGGAPKTQRVDIACGAVASAAPAATEAGLTILRAGGNAADAAVAVALALAVVHPQAGNLGGGGFALTRFDGSVEFLDFREMAPAAATRDMYLGRDGAPVPDLSLVGPLAAGVPGSPAGLYELHRRRGRLPWREVVEPALALARDGFAVTERLTAAIEDSRDLLEKFRETADVWLPEGAPPAPGATMRVPRLAETLADYAARGPAAITTGTAAEAIEAASSRHGGILRASDLRAYSPVWREPIRISAFGWEFAAAPPPSSGGVILGQTLGILERLEWPLLARDDPQRAHLLVEAWRRAFADRVLLGDPSAITVRPAQLLDKSWLDRRVAEIDRERATPSSAVREWRSEPAEKRETTHLSVIDGAGDAVSLTTTLNESFGCGLLVPEVGFLLNNEMDDFTTAAGRPNLFGLIQGPANQVGAGKRMLSSMSPTIAWRGDDVIALGSRGGSYIPTSVTQVLLNTLVDGDQLDAAVRRPRLHHQWRPDEILAESGALSADATEDLQRRGHTVRAERRLGEVHAVRRRADGVFEAAADQRRPSAGAVCGPLPH